MILHGRNVTSVIKCNVLFLVEKRKVFTSVISAVVVAILMWCAVGCKIQPHVMDVEEKMLLHTPFNLYVGLIVAVIMSTAVAGAQEMVEGVPTWNAK